VLLTARSICDWWTVDLAPALQRENVQFTLLKLDVSSRHPMTSLN
jgi:hypothetical protein